jgi:hypothetical protein
MAIKLLKIREMFKKQAKIFFSFLPKFKIFLKQTLFIYMVAKNI